MGYLYWIIGYFYVINLWCGSDGVCSDGFRLFRRFGQTVQTVRTVCSDDIVMGEVGLLELAGISC